VRAAAVAVQDSRRFGWCCVALSGSRDYHHRYSEVTYPQALPSLLIISDEHRYLELTQCQGPGILDMWLIDLIAQLTYAKRMTNPIFKLLAEIKFFYSGMPLPGRSDRRRTSLEE
jgi:hypothetical protein